MTNLLKYILLSIILLFIPALLSAQETITVRGKVVSGNRHLPIINAQVSSPAARSTSITEADGTFTIEVSNLSTQLEIKADNYYTLSVPLLKRTEVTVFLIPQKSVMYTNELQTPDGIINTQDKIGSSLGLNIKDMNLGYSSVDNALAGKFQGLRVLNKSGMPGEGSFVNMHGIRSFVSENTPLIVVDGLPYLSDLSVSSAINGFSKNIFSTVNLKDIESVSYLKGADAAIYGSLGSNGVLMINTQRATNLETQVEFHTMEGVGYMKKRIPVMRAEAFKNYISDIGETRYSDLNSLIEVFPFLKDDPEDHYRYLYNNDVDWQKEIYTPTFISENMLRIMGGDAVATYALSAGYLYNGGIIENTQQQKYYTRLNSNINILRNLDIFTTVAFNYSIHDLMEQGMVKETNPILAALYKSPLLSVYEQNANQENLPNFNPVRQFGISNPASIVSDVDAQSRSYDVIVDLGVNYAINPYVSIHAMGGLYYNYTKENNFIPGVSSGAIAPLMNGLADNTVRAATAENVNYYFKGNIKYANIFDDLHDFSAVAAYQLMSSRRELDFGSGINTASDFYQSLGSTTDARRISGYIDEWRWMNGYAKVNYGYNSQYYLGATLSVDGSSSYGKNSARAFVFASGQAAWKIKNSPFLRNVEAITNLTLRGEYGLNGNSRYSSNYSKYYYVSEPLRDVSGLIRAGLPNLQIKPEKNLTANVGIDLSLLGNRINLTLDVYQEKTKDMVLDMDMAPAYGFRTRFANAGEMRTRGIESALNINVLNKGDFSWNVGGNIASFKSKVLDLGGPNSKTITYSDGTQLRSEVGKAPNLFWGHKVEKVLYSKEEAQREAIYSNGGVMFSAGDIKFQDLDGNKIINDNDKQVIGDPTPDFYGGFYTHFTYKNFSLFANFTYSYGNDIYNVVRRGTESMTGFENQSVAAERRWTSDGQVTNMPRAVYGDPIGNSRFSDRWIEDGSYLKLKEITLTYDSGKKVWVFRNLKAYITGENLFTSTKYLGLDPEFSYSYDMNYLGMDLGKVPLMRNVKLGVILNF